MLHCTKTTIVVCDSVLHISGETSANMKNMYKLHKRKVPARLRALLNNNKAAFINEYLYVTININPMITNIFDHQNIFITFKISPILSY